jgi:hypothetical protein
MPPRPAIAIVVAYFGQAPLGLPAFLVSCRHNPDVRWLIYTDFAVPSEVPANVTFRPMQLDELSARASDAVHARVALSPSYPRKICDLKPAYGAIFADDMREFDFWAYSDLDIVWGDVRRFMTDELLAAHDIVSSRLGRLSGHFTLFRNTARVNQLFELVPGLDAALIQAPYRGIDERELTRVLRQHSSATHRLRSLLRRRSEAAPRVYWRRDLTTDATQQRLVGDDAASSLWWRDGRVFDTRSREFMYVHFHKLEKYMETIDFGVADAPPAFAINRRGFRAARQRAASRMSPSG